MSHRIAIKVTVIVLALYPTGLTHSALQDQSSKNSAPLIFNGNSNEDAKVGLDDVAAAGGTDKLIIMIARLGSKESSRTLSRRRLRTARAYLKHTRSVPAERIIIAEGEAVKGQGRVEAYVDGRLYRVFMMGRSRDFAPEP